MTDQNSYQPKNDKWFAFPYFVTNRWFIPFCIVNTLLAAVLWTLYCIQSGEIMELLLQPSPYINLLVGSFFIVVYSYSIKIVERFLGISLNEGAVLSSSTPPLRSLFASDSQYNSFQKKTLKNLKNRWIWIVAIILAVIVFILFYVETYNINTNDKQLRQLLGLPSLEYSFGIVLFIYWPLFLTLIYGSSVVILSILFIIVTSISEVGRDRTWLAIRRLKLSDMEGNIKGYQSREEDKKYSLEGFKRKAAIIPSFTFRVALLMIAGLVVLNAVFMAYIFPLMMKEKYLGYTLGYLAFFVVVDIYYLAVTGFVFIYPQIAIMVLIEEEKEKQLEFFEELYDIKKMEYLQSIVKNKSVEAVFNQLKYLEVEIAKTEGMTPWPFRYRQIGILITSPLGIPILAVLNFLLTELLPS